MFINAGYLNNSRAPYKDKSRPLIVSSCGNYRLSRMKKMPTWRPRGRLDYQLLYIVSGKTHFYFGGQERIVTAGHMVLIQPRQEQKYEYFGEEKPEVYWVHFTGSNVKNLLRRYHIPMNDPVFYSGVSASYAALFREMIGELQTSRTGFEELLEMYLRQLFLLIRRAREEERPVASSYLIDEMEAGRRYFHEHYNEPVSVEEYAQSRGMSVSWFIRSFKLVTGKTPMQYILAIRISNAVSLLETTDYNVNEISAIVGYDNPLYFSRSSESRRASRPQITGKYTEPGLSPLPESSSDAPSVPSALGALLLRRENRLRREMGDLFHPIRPVYGPDGCIE